MVVENVGVERSPELDPKRTFSRADVWRVFQTQGEACALCRRALPFDLMHGDHIVPWSKGGRTALENLQVLCGACNLRKGSKPQDVVEQYFNVAKLAPGQGSLRRWQAEALPIVMDVLQREPMLVEACPGAGKTQFALEVAFRLLESGEVSRLLVVVPTLGIADGWLMASSPTNPNAPTIPLHSQRDWSRVNPIGDAWAGAIITYQSLFASPEMFLAHASDPGHRTLVIFDEVHHAGADNAWGTAGVEAFASSAKAILSLSGTPFRTGGDPIVFVPSEKGVALPQYRYGYADAIRDRACRPVQFVEARGRTKFRTEDNEVHEVDFDDTDLTATGERKRLRAAIEWIGEGGIAHHLLHEANNYLLSLRAQGDRDAAGLVVCVDCDHAADVAEFMSEHLVPKRATVACSRLRDSNDPNPANAVRTFRTSHDPWIVAVNMVSEGVDITRLRAVVYLTNRLTTLAFRQIVGRVVRSDPQNVDDFGRVYLPADPRLVKMAVDVQEEVKLLPPPIVIVTDKQPVTRVIIRSDESVDRVAFEVLDTQAAEGAAFDTSGRRAEVDLLARAREFIRREGLKGTDAASLALAASDSPALRDALLALDMEA